jgi:putative ABC transport system permease protein
VLNPNPAIFFRLLLAEWRAYPLRLLLALLAIAAGVALGFCVHLVNGSAISHFSDALAEVSGQYDLEISARQPSGFDESIYPRIAALADVAVASPSVESRVALEGSTAPLHIVGVDVFTAREINPVVNAPALQLGAGGDFFAPDAIFVHPSLLDERHQKIGDRLTVIIDGQPVELRIAGVANGSDTRLALMDIGNAQWRLGFLHRLSHIAIKRSPALSLEQLRAELSPLVPASAVLLSPKDDMAQTDRLSRAYRVNLDMLALMALFTGGFLVYSTQSLSVLRRGRQHALLRVIGVTRRGLIRQVLVEGTLLGLAGGVLGLLLGALLAATLLHAMGGDLGGGYFSNQTTALVFQPGAALLFLGFGIAASALGSLGPARRAARNATAAALKAQDEAFDPRRTPPVGVALGLLAGAAMLTFMPALDGVAVGAYLAMGMLLFASIAAMPAVVRLCVALMSRLLSERMVMTGLAARRLWAAPTQGTIALSGIVASASLMVAMATMVFSFRASVDDWLGGLLSADVYLHVTGSSASFSLSPATQQALSSLEGVKRVNFLSTESLVLKSDQPPVALLVRDYQGDRPEGLPILRERSGPTENIAPVWISEAMEQLYGWSAGDVKTLTLTRLDGTSTGVKVEVQGIWRDYARQTGSIVIDSDSYNKATGRLERSDAAFTLRAGASSDELRTRIMAALPEGLATHAQLASPAEIRRTSLVIFDRSFAITYLLEVVAIGIGLAGVAATFSAQTIARAREFGMLRHLGVKPREILSMLLAEVLGLAVIGVMVGLMVGLAEGQILIQRVNPQSFHWTMETHVPWLLLAGIGAALVLASAGTALVSGRGALSMDAVHAVRDDW